MPKEPLVSIVTRALACQTCCDVLPHPPRPVLRMASGARIAIISQAPGAKVHASGVPWQDDSGDHLIEWLGIDRPTFEDANRFAIMPMGFCWPGRRKGGDLPPRPECAPQWHAPLLAALPQVELTLLVGQYAQAYYLRDRAKASLTDTVAAYRDYLPSLWPLPHPSWRSRLWMKNHPWFGDTILPELQARVAQLVA